MQNSDLRSIINKGHQRIFAKGLSLFKVGSCTALMGQVKLENELLALLEIREIENRHKKKYLQAECVELPCEELKFGMIIFQTEVTECLLKIQLKMFGTSVMLFVLLTCPGPDTHHCPWAQRVQEDGQGATDWQNH